MKAIVLVGIALLALVWAVSAFIFVPRLGGPRSLEPTLPVMNHALRCYEPSVRARRAAAVAHVIAVTDEQGRLREVRLVEYEPVGTVGFLHARSVLRAVRDCAPYPVESGLTVLTFGARE